VLAGGIAHDFNNLLVGILGNADLALRDLPPNSPARDNLEEIGEAAGRAADLARQMLAYSGRGRFVVETVSLMPLVQEMANLLQVALSKNAVLEYDFAEDTPCVEADATQLRQVVMNLITNASEAVGETSGVVTVATGSVFCDSEYLAGCYLADGVAEGEYAFLEVSDTGHGMDAETVAKAFEPFFTTKFTGRGLGLSAVLGIVRGHHGAMRVDSEPGHGTTFRVLLPAVGDPAPPTDQPVVPDGGWRGDGTVLLVDDEETVRQVGTRILERLGFRVLTAVDGEQAVSVFARDPQRVDCVLLDLTMPNMGGEETFHELRNVRRDIRVIVTSGYTEQDVTARFAGKGLSGFVEKPFTIDRLQAALRLALEAAL
jgi:two-component system cell cycle sensor histidine kinase/response regulator CckA